MKIVKLLLAIALCATFFTGCIPKQSYDNYPEIVLEAGVTTKAVVLQTLGAPDLFSGNSLTYLFSSQGAKVHFKYKDGTEFFVIFKVNGGKSLSMFFDDDGLLK